uniref:Uncharacterized protein n=1 Tax=Oncorhynchus kisutch TaxID=8019 RepID=A0A8C7H8Z5_ONCKI
MEEDLKGSRSKWVMIEAYGEGGSLCVQWGEVLGETVLEKPKAPGASIFGKWSQHLWQVEPASLASRASIFGK